MTPEERAAAIYDQVLFQYGHPSDSTSRTEGVAWVLAEIRAAIAERDLEWSKALGFWSADFGKATSPEQAADFLREAAEIRNRK